MAISGTTGPNGAAAWATTTDPAKIIAGLPKDIQAQIAARQTPTPSLGKVGLAVGGAMAAGAGGVFLAEMLEDKASPGTGIAGAGVAGVGTAVLATGLMQLGSPGRGGLAAGLGILGAGVLGLGGTMMFQGMLAPIKDDL